MSLFTRFVRINIAMLIFVSSALAEVPEELRNFVLTGDMNGRSSVDFRAQANNVTAFVPKGTRGEVLEVRKLARTGSYGIKMKVTEVATKATQAKNSVQKDQEVWVYFSSKKSPWLRFKDLNGETVQDPEEALTAQAKRDGEALPAVPGTVRSPDLPTREEVLRNSVDPNLEMKDRNQTEGDWCPVIPCATPQVIFPQKNIEQVEEVMKVVSPEAKKVIETERAPRSTPADPQNKWAHDPLIMKYSESADTKKAVRFAMANKNGRSNGYCYRAVKRALVASKQVKKYPPGGHARDAIKDLKAQGWINLMDNPAYKNKIKSPADVPKGAVVVTWNYLRKESGDVAFKTDWGDKGGWVSDYYSPRPMKDQPKGRRYARKGQPYEMIGVMIKP